MHKNKIVKINPPLLNISKKPLWMGTYPEKVKSLPAYDLKSINGELVNKLPYKGELRNFQS